METHQKVLAKVKRCLVLSHSLGKLIEWKLSNFKLGNLGELLSHSLGKLIEWKPS